MNSVVAYGTLNGILHIFYDAAQFRKWLDENSNFSQVGWVNGMEVHKPPAPRKYYAVDIKPSDLPKEGLRTECILEQIYDPENFEIDPNLETKP